MRKSSKVSRLTTNTLCVLLLGLLLLGLQSTYAAPAPIGSSDTEDPADGALDAELDAALKMEQEIEEVGSALKAKNGKKKARLTATAVEIVKAKKAWETAKAEAKTKKKALHAANAEAKTKKKAWLAANAEAKKKKKAWEKRRWKGKGKGKHQPQWPSCAKGGTRLLCKEELVDSQCKPTNKTLFGISDMVKLNMSSTDHPEWQMRNDCHDAEGRKWWEKGAGRIKSCHGKPAKILCPCSDSNGTELSAQTAFEQILGQLAGVDVVNSHHIKPALATKFERMRSALATITMLNCWKDRCAKDEDDDEEDNTGTRGSSVLPADISRRRRRRRSWGQRRLLQAPLSSPAILHTASNGLNAYTSILNNLDVGSSAEWGGGLAC